MVQHWKVTCRGSLGLFPSIAEIYDSETTATAVRTKLLKVSIPMHLYALLISTIATSLDSLGCNGGNRSAIAHLTH
jgi:hypothetical protein